MQSSGKKKKTDLFAAVMALLSTGCSHAVYSLDVDLKNREIISSALKDRCENSCSLDECWRETEAIMVCNVGFSFTPSYTKEETLATASNNLKNQSLNVNFCGHDSIGTQMVGAFFGGMGGAIAAHAIGTPASGATLSGVVVGQDNALSVGDPETVIQQACASPPILDKAAQ